MDLRSKIAEEAVHVPQAPLKRRDWIEIMFCRLKDWARVETGYD